MAWAGTGRFAGRVEKLLDLLKAAVWNDYRMLGRPSRPIVEFRLSTRLMRGLRLFATRGQRQGNREESNESYGSHGVFLTDANTGHCTRGRTEEVFLPKSSIQWNSSGRRPGNATIEQT